MSRRTDQECLSHVASVYYEAHARTGDHGQAFVDTVRTALLSGYQPYAAWVTEAMLHSGRPTHAVVLSHPEAAAVYKVIVGGVAIDLHTSILSEVYMPETGLGWRLIDGADHDRYMRWARQEPEPPQLEMDFAMGMAP
ncbi:hypothetical protein [Pseudomonas aeruginosa]|uniref:hypothetical protein n=1 Tax=Pseudomonas aeruginosa TaxID=287 RepID=UPI002E2D0012|nr:hypothetical protein [Pseudomonas aeruginosa]HBO2103432.1 hypothetical protein [Pseudomonas aeruginosa]